MSAWQTYKAKNPGATKASPWQTYKAKSMKSFARQAVAEMWLPVNAVLKQLGDRVDATQAAAMEPLTQKFSTGKSEPIGQALKDLALAPITGNPPAGYTRGDAAYESGVKAGLKPWQARTLSVLGSFPAAEGMNMVGKYALAPGARAAGELTRKVPGVKEFLNFRRPGAGLPKAMREGFYEDLRTEEGLANVRKFSREQALGAARKLPAEAQNRIGHAIETGNVASLPDNLQRVARAMTEEFRVAPIERAARGGRPFALRGESKVEFVPRYPEKFIGKKAFGDPVALSTKPGEMRNAAGLQMTSEEIRAAGLPLKPSVEAAMLHGEAADRQIMRLGIVDRLDKRFGRPVRLGETPIAKIPGLASGFTKARKAELAGRAWPKEVHEIMENLNSRLQPDEWGRWSNFMRTVNDQFKKWALVLPGTASRNLQNNIAQIAIRGNLDPETVAWAGSLRLQMAQKKLSPEMLAEAKDAIKSGALGHGFEAMETGTKGTSKALSRLYNYPFRGSRAVNSFIEDVSRLALYRWLKKKEGMSSMAAGAEVDRILGNYSPVFQSKGFSKLRRGWWPFINWDMTIPEVFAKTTLQRPGSVGQVGRTLSNISKISGGVPEAQKDYQRERGVIPVGSGDYSPQAYGPFDIQGMTASVGRDVTNVHNVLKGGKFYGSDVYRELASKTYPLQGIAYAIQTGRDPFTGWPIRDWPQFFANKAPLVRDAQLIRDFAQGKPGARSRLLSALGGIKMRNEAEIQGRE